jgi:4-carboxymuconolactone decarboxylase
VPRIPPLRDDELDDRARQLLRDARPPRPDVVNAFATLVRHPDLFEAWRPFSRALAHGSLPPRDRELAILRTAWLCQAEYEWAQHVITARDLGLDDDDFDAVRAGPDDPSWPTRDAALLRAADELHAHSVIADATWSVLTAHYDEHQLIELPMLIGHYHLMAFTLRSLGVQLEDGVS